MATKIVIEVNGGVVQEVYSNDPAVTVIVVDWDTDGAEPGNGNYIVTDELGNKHFAHAVIVNPTSIDMLPMETKSAVEAARTRRPDTG